MRIMFVLPIPPRNPIGGVRVAYEYANHLSERGHEVTVVYPGTYPSPGVRGLWRRSYWRARRASRSFDGHPSWLPVAPAVRSVKVDNLVPSLLPPADAVFATGWQTAQTVYEAPDRCGRKFQLVQHYETWAGPQRKVDQSLRLPLTKIVISRWLRDVVEGLGQASRTTYIPNGLDFDTFFLESDPSERKPAQVAMLLHKSEWKGTRYGLEALRLAHARRPQLRASLFSPAYRPRGLPDWMEYHQRPFGESLRRIYNNAAIFLHPSLSEGWGLPPAEAMACGCAVVAADNLGVLDFAVADQTALVVPRGDASALADAIVRLIDDEELRMRIARAGTVAISQYTWDRAVDAFEKAARGPASAVSEG